LPTCCSGKQTQGVHKSGVEGGRAMLYQGTDTLYIGVESATDILYVAMPTKVCYPRPLQLIKATLSFPKQVLPPKLTCVLRPV
jgi:hypothetical protein